MLGAPWRRGGAGGARMAVSSHDVARSMALHTWLHRSGPSIAQGPCWFGFVAAPIALGLGLEGNEVPRRRGQLQDQLGPIARHGRQRCRPDALRRRLAVDGVKVII